MSEELKQVCLGLYFVYLRVCVSARAHVRERQTVTTHRAENTDVHCVHTPRGR